MIKERILEQIQDSFYDVLIECETLSEAEFFAKSSHTKSSAAEFVTYLSVLLAQNIECIRHPELLLSEFGNSNRLSREWDVFQADMEEISSDIGKVPKAKGERISQEEISKADLVSTFDMYSVSFMQKMSRWTDSDMDLYQIPLPAIGLVTVKEMLFFIAILIRNHSQAIKAIKETARLQSVS